MKWKLIVAVLLVLVVGCGQTIPTATPAPANMVPDTIGTPLFDYEGTMFAQRFTEVARASMTPIVQTVVVTATPMPATPVPTAAPTSVPTAVPAVPTQSSQPTVQAPSTPISTQQMGSWTIEYFDGATSQMKGWKFQDLVKDWSAFPNVDFPKYGFKAADGVEYGMAESAYCQRAKTCDVNIPAMHYRLVTGDYVIPGIDTCMTGIPGLGCGIVLVNVGTVTAMYRESTIDYGFTVEGRYWNGDAMPTTVRALMSNTAYNMLNIGATIGPFTMPVNKGANCSSPFGCQRVRLTFAITSGNQLLVKGTAFVSR